MSNNLRIFTNWRCTKNLTDSFNINYDKDNDLERPELDEFVSTDSSILLEKVSDEVLCEVNIDVNPRYLPSSLALVTNCGKMEVFIGKLKEYYKTPSHELIDDYEGDKTYRFDVKFDKPIMSFSLKFINQNNDLWIYGGFMSLVINTNPMGNLTGSLINFSNVQTMLNESNHNVSADSSKKCTEFFKLYMSNKAKENISQMNDNLNNLQLNETPTNKEIDLIKLYFDNKIEILENNIKKHINERFSEYELKQNEKLNDIINLINSRK